MPGQYPSNGLTVTFAGVEIGWLSGHDWEAKISELVDKTSAASRVVGSGANARVVKEYDATSIEPVLFSFTFWGPPSYSADDAGLKGELVFDAPGLAEPIAGEAILMDFRHSGRSGQWATGSANFQLTGADEGS